MRFFFLLFACICIVESTQAQLVRKRLDSFLALVPQAEEDSHKVLILCDVAYRYFQIDTDSGIIYAKKAIELADRLDYKRGLVSGNMAIARCYAVQHSYADALRHFQDALILTREIKDYDREQATLISLGSVYNGMREPDKALEYYLQAKDVSQYAKQDMYGSIMGSIGHIYMIRREYDKALKYFNMGIEHEEAKNNPLTILASLYGKVGLLYYNTDSYGIALYWFFKTLDLHRKIGNEKSAANQLNSIGYLYYEAATKSELKLPDSLQNKRACLKKALPYLEQSAEICEKIGWTKVLWRSTGNLAAVNKELGNYKQAYEYKDLQGVLNDSLRDYNEEKKFAKVEAEYAVKKTTDSLNFANQIKDTEIVQRKTERNGIIIVLALVGLSSALLINRQIIRRKKLKAEKDLADSKLEKAQQRLSSFTQNLKEKNQLIEDFSAEVERLQALPCSNELPDTKENLAKLQSSIILTDDQWEEFKTTFEEVHEGFLYRLREKLPDLTPAETRYVALTKLRLNNKEMASMLGVGAAAVRNYKYRLFKKLNLPAESDVITVVDEI